MPLTHCCHQRRRLRLMPIACALAASFTMSAFAADEAAQLALGKKLFTQTAVPACALCHTLKDAGSEAAVGPVLDELKPDADRVATALRNGLGTMPSYKATLSEEQISAIALYVSKASGEAK